MNLMNTYPIKEKVLIIISELLKNHRTVKELSELLDCSKRTIYRILKTIVSMRGEIDLELNTRREEEIDYFYLSIV